MRSWLLDLAAGALHEDPALEGFSGRVSDSGEGRWTALAAIETGAPAPVLTAALFARFSSRGEDDYANRLLSAMRAQFGGHAERQRRRRRARSPAAMSADEQRCSDALVFFGATGDLAFKQIFPALQRMVRRGDLDVPIVGVAREHWNLDKLRDPRARQPRGSTAASTRAPSRRLSASCDTSGGDYDDPQTFANLREALGGCERPVHYLAIPPELFATVVEPARRRRARRAGPRRRREAVRPRSRVGAARSTARCCACSPRSASSASTTSSARRRSRTSSSSASPTRSSSRSGTATTSPDPDHDGRGLRRRRRAARSTRSVGAIRDVVAEPLFQVLTLLAMDPSAARTPRRVRDEKARFLRGVRTLAPDDVVRGQYRGYRESRRRRRAMHVETYAALRLNIDTWRWADVPFSCAPASACRSRRRRSSSSSSARRSACSRSSTRTATALRFQIDPDVVIGIEVQTRRAESTASRSRTSSWSRCAQAAHEVPPYQRLLTAALRGRARRCSRARTTIEEAWRIVDPILGDATPVHLYEPGTLGTGRGRRA